MTTDRTAPTDVAHEEMTMTTDSTTCPVHSTDLSALSPADLATLCSTQQIGSLTGAVDRCTLCDDCLARVRDEVSDRWQAAALDGLDIRRGGGAVVVRDGHDTWLASEELWSAGLASMRVHGAWSHDTYRRAFSLADGTGAAGASAYTDLCQSMPAVSSIGDTTLDPVEAGRLITAAVECGLVEDDAAEELWGDATVAAEIGPA